MSGDSEIKTIKLQLHLHKKNEMLCIPVHAEEIKTIFKIKVGHNKEILFLLHSKTPCILYCTVLCVYTVLYCSVLVKMRCTNYDGGVGAGAVGVIQAPILDWIRSNW